MNESQLQCKVPWDQGVCRELAEVGFARWSWGRKGSRWGKPGWEHRKTSLTAPGRGRMCGAAAGAVQGSAWLLREEGKVCPHAAPEYQAGAQPKRTVPWARGRSALVRKQMLPGATEGAKSHPNS